ncbi:MAG: hypothetical protein FWC94_02050 [Bacteroidales bacterium]|nr:hypothetical protein [Bacteroidales bacterium]
MQKISIILFGLLLSFSGLAETHIATQKLDRSEIQIGDHIQLTISLQTDENNAIIFPALSDTMDSRIVFISVENIDTIQERRRSIRTYSRVFTLTIFESGEYIFPPLPFLIRTPDSIDFFKVLTNYETIIVTAPEVDLVAGIRDIREIWGIPITFREILPFLLILLLVGLLTFAGIYLYRKWKKQEPLLIFKPKPVIPAHVEALESLEKLRLKQLWQNNLVKEYYTELTDILRIYTEKGLHISAIEMTSDEFIEAVENSEFENKSKLLELLRNTLPTADLVKFAKAEPLADQHDRCFKEVKLFVELTMPKEKVEEEKS